MHHRDRTLELRVGEIQIILTYLFRSEHTLVRDRTRGEAADVEIILALHLRGCDPVRCPLSDGIELALEYLLTVITREEQLHDVWFIPLRHGPLGRMVHRHIPAEYGVDTIPLAFLLYDGEAGVPFGSLFRQEDVPDAVSSDLRDMDPHGQEERVRYLHRDPCAVAGLAIGILSTAMLHVVEDPESIFDYAVTLGAVDVQRKADTA